MPRLSITHLCFSFLGDEFLPFGEFVLLHESPPEQAAILPKKDKRTQKRNFAAQATPLV